MASMSERECLMALCNICNMDIGDWVPLGVINFRFHVTGGGGATGNPISLGQQATTKTSCRSRSFHHGQRRGNRAEKTKIGARIGQENSGVRHCASPGAVGRAVGACFLEPCVDFSTIYSVAHDRERLRRW